MSKTPKYYCYYIRLLEILKLNKKNSFKNQLLKPKRPFIKHGKYIVYLGLSHLILTMIFHHGNRKETTIYAVN